MKSRASSFNLISTKSRIFKWKFQVYQNKTLQNVSADHNNTIMTADRCNSLWSSGKGKTFYTHNLVHPKVWQTCCTIFEFELLIHCWFLWLQHETCTLNMRQIMWCWSVDAWREVKQFLVTGHAAGIIISHFCHVIKTDHLHQYFHNVCCGSVL